MNTRRFEQCQGFALVAEGVQEEWADVGLSEAGFDLDGLGVAVRLPWPTTFTVSWGVEDRPEGGPNAFAHVLLDLPHEITTLRFGSIEELSEGQGERLEIVPGDVGSVLIAMWMTAARYMILLRPVGSTHPFEPRRLRTPVHLVPWSAQSACPGVMYTREGEDLRPALPQVRPPKEGFEPSTQGVDIDACHGWIAFFHPDTFWEHGDHEVGWFLKPAGCTAPETEGRLILWGPGRPKRVRVLVHIGHKPKGLEAVRQLMYRSTGSAFVTAAADVGRPELPLRIPAGDWWVFICAMAGSDTHHLVFLPARYWFLPEEHPDTELGLPLSFDPPGEPDTDPLPGSLLEITPSIIQWGDDGVHWFRFMEDGTPVLDGQILPFGGGRLAWIDGDQPKLRIQMPDGPVVLALPPRPSFLRHLQLSIELFGI